MEQQDGMMKRLLSQNSFLSGEVRMTQRSKQNISIRLNIGVLAMSALFLLGHYTCPAPPALS